MSFLLQQLHPEMRLLLTVFSVLKLNINDRVIIVTSVYILFNSILW